MARQKRQRFAQNALAENVIEKGKPLYTAIKGKWREVYFNNTNPIVLELACGKGEYTVGLGQLFPEKNFIGIDIKGERIARGSRQALQARLDNVAFLRTGIQYMDEFFLPDEVDEIWLVHPDPQPKDKDEKKRLTNPFFLGLYATYLKEGGLFHLKTDNPFLYQYSLETLQNLPAYSVLEHTDNLYESPQLEAHHGIETHYEKLFVAKGFTINYIKARVLNKNS